MCTQEHCDGFTDNILDYMTPESQCPQTNFYGNFLLMVWDILEIMASRLQSNSRLFRRSDLAMLASSAQFSNLTQFVKSTQPVQLAHLAQFDKFISNYR